jgi:hypothetical protein
LKTIGYWEAKEKFLAFKRGHLEQKSKLFWNPMALKEK